MNELTLNDKNLAVLNAMIDEIPHKHARGLMIIFNRKIAEQQKEMATNVQPLRPASSDGLT
jgi:hypothetical protein